MKKLRITVDGKTYEVEVEVLGSRIASVAPVAAAPAPVAAVPVVAAPVAAAPAPKAPAPAAPAVAGASDVACPLAAVVVSVNVKEGQQVKTGDLLVMLEAMKMNTPINALKDGTVSKIYVAAGQSVQEGQPLISLS